MRHHLQLNSILFTFSVNPSVTVCPTSLAQLGLRLSETLCNVPRRGTFPYASPTSSVSGIIVSTDLQRITFRFDKL
ncbi:unnamed protein product [Protopolystoma xenopodis]|uniref:Uncharacterized protein n=1 Tax=Protopolystoma xenopodis TaxID=117903 RepID=A0A448WVW0_9PLAT|nr:unnamed protein product [Protopolystoma xenopodis]